MPQLCNYKQFDGLHWETGTVRNALDYQGVTAPHTGRPFSEAMLMGISGGAVMGYFSFSYEGHDPQARILTRNTFNPWDTMLSRLGVIQTVLHTTKPDKAVINLVETLENETPPVVWADMFSLPYNNLPWGDDIWAMMPILVIGYDEASEQVKVADRSLGPLTVTPQQLAEARGRVKKDKHRIITLDLPHFDKLEAAVRAGIWDSIKLYTEKPPKGSKNNFGLAAYNYWAKLLTKRGERMSWTKQFPPGRKMYAGLTSQYFDINMFGKNGRAERDTYADFLDEAAVLLKKTSLSDAANAFRRSAEAWADLSLALLPDDIALFKESRELLDKRYQLFLQNGDRTLEEREAITKRLEEIATAMESDFPLSEAEANSLRESIAEKVLTLHDVEAEAVEKLKAGMAGG